MLPDGSARINFLPPYVATGNQNNGPVASIRVTFKDALPTEPHGRAALYFILFAQFFSARSVKRDVIPDRESRRRHQIDLPRPGKVNYTHKVLILVCSCLRNRLIWWAVAVSQNLMIRNA